MGLPTHVFKEVFGSLITLEKPKSQILNSPLLINIFAGYHAECLSFA